MTAIFAVCLSACAKTPVKEGSGSAAHLAADKQLHIVATIFPAYDWVQAVLGDNPAKVQATCLLNNGVDMHSFQPSVDHIVQISTCDVFIYVGGTSDAWVEDALKEAVNPDMIVLNLLDILGEHAKEEELVLGMQEESHEEEAHSHDHAHEHEEEIELDEHVWLSLKNAALFTQAIADALAQADEANKDSYQENAQAYSAQLEALDAAYEETVQKAAKQTLVFADRFPFRYLMDDYGLSYFAAFPGCSSETEASFETILFLADRVDTLGLSAILTETGANQKIAEAVCRNTKTQDQSILTLHSIQSVTAKEMADGLSYLQIMQDNLRVLEEALQ